MEKKRFIIVLIFIGVMVFQSCTNSNPDSSKSPAIDKEQLTQQIKQLEDTLKAKAEQQIDRKLAKELINKSVAYVEAFPDDELSPAYLFRAGNVAVGISSFEEAANYFEMIHQKYTSYKRAPDALFLEGFTYENHLKDIEKAKKCYNDFLTRYPDDQLADQVRIVLENIDKTPEELVKSFQKK